MHASGKNGIIFFVGIFLTFGTTTISGGIEIHEGTINGQISHNYYTGNDLYSSTDIHSKNGTPLLFGECLLASIDSAGEND